MEKAYSIEKHQPTPKEPDDHECMEFHIKLNQIQSLILSTMGPTFHPQN